MKAIIAFIIFVAFNLAIILLVKAIFVPTKTTIRDQDIPTIAHWYKDNKYIPVTSSEIRYIMDLEAKEMDLETKEMDLEVKDVIEYKNITE